MNIIYNYIYFRNYINQRRYILDKTCLQQVAKPVEQDPDLVNIKVNSFKKKLGGSKPVFTCGTQVLLQCLIPPLASHP